MRKIWLTLFLLAVPACAESRQVNGRQVNSYGLLSKYVEHADQKQPDVDYKVCKGNVFWAIMTSEGVVGPLYFIGFSLFEPTGPKYAPAQK